MSSSESSSADEQPNRKHLSKQKQNSTNNRFECNNCEKLFKCRAQIVRHLQTCVISTRNLTCHWCKLSFTNRWNLGRHALQLHGDPSYQNENVLARKNTFYCHICQRSFGYNHQLKYHIRQIHFNMIGKRPYAELKKVNQVWFEKVLNSNNIMEIKKTGQNTLVMRKLHETTAINVQNDNSNVVDVSHIYPVRRYVEKAKCRLCGKMFIKKDLKKHLEEKHYNKTKHKCNNCNRTFKRSYYYLQHVCKRMQRVKGVKQFHNELWINSIESLSIPST